MKLSAFLTLAICGGLLFAAVQPKFDPLPVPVSNNAVAILKNHNQFLIYSFMGIGAKRTWNSITTDAYSLDTLTGKWTPIHGVPGVAGRLAAVAASARGHIFLFGGYVVDADANETTTSGVEVYEPFSDHWFRGADMPIPVDDSLAGVYRDRYIYLVSGWSKTEAVRNVQVYDAEKNAWQQATPIPGTPVFVHAGGLTGDTIIYIDGATKNPSGDRPKYIASDECWMGKIDHRNPANIQWTKIPSHPGAARYRIAAGSPEEGSEKDKKIYFSGGTANPYNYTGIGYDGNPSEPSPMTFAYNLRTSKWEIIDENTPNPTMDHRGLVVTPQSLVIIGGIEQGQKVTPQVQVLPKQPNPR